MYVYFRAFIKRQYTVAQVSRIQPPQLICNAQDHNVWCFTNRLNLQPSHCNNGIISFVHLLIIPMGKKLSIKAAWVVAFIPFYVANIPLGGKILWSYFSQIGGFHVFVKWPLRVLLKQQKSYIKWIQYEYKIKIIYRLDRKKKEMKLALITTEIIFYFNALH